MSLTQVLDVSLPFSPDGLLAPPADVASEPPPAPASSLAALRAWRRALGEEHVRCGEGTRTRYARSTSPPGTAPAAVLTPGSAAEVQEAVRIAGRYSLALHPISRGKNWGYGDACAPRDAQVILDLRRLDRIIEVEPRLGYAVVEPGVTQGQLSDHLREHYPDLWMDATGAGREASVVGNALERGFGHTPYGDRFLTTCGLEVVMADGRLLRTGFGGYSGARARHVHRYGVGPFLDGLFTQSNLGVVTRMGVWLMPRPEAFCAFFFAVEREEDLADVVERLAQLRLRGTVQSAVHIGNDLRLMSSHARYPWERAGGETPLPPGLRAALRREHGLGAWNVCGALYGDRAVVAAARRVVRQAVAPYRPVFVTPRRLRLLGRLQRVLSRFGCGGTLAERLAAVQPIMDILQGIPNDEPLRGATWRVRGDLPEEAGDPLDRHAGLRWVSPALPATGAAAREVVDLMAPIYERHGFEALVTFTLVSPRAMCCVSNLAFDIREADEARRAEACHHELLSALLDAGYVPYRAGPASGRMLADRGCPVLWDTNRLLKRALDPADVLSPGRW